MKKIGFLKKLRRTSAFDVISNILIIILCVISVFPIYWMCVSSIKYSSDVVKIPPDWIPSRVTLRNYVDMFRNNPVFTWIVNSIVVTALTIVGVAAVSSAAGFALSKMDFYGKKLVNAFVLSALLIPMEIYIIPLYKEIVAFGWKGTYWAYVLPNVAMPFGVYLIRNFYDSIPGEIMEAASVDGCGKIRFFFCFGLPLSKSGIAALAILTGVRTWNNYIWQLLAASNSPDSYTLPVGIAKLFTDPLNLDYGVRFAAATVSALPLFLVFFAFQRFFTEGVSAGAVKG